MRPPKTGGIPKLAPEHGAAFLDGWPREKRNLFSGAQFKLVFRTPRASRGTGCPSERPGFLSRSRTPKTLGRSPLGIPLKSQTGCSGKGRKKDWTRKKEKGGGHGSPLLGVHSSIPICELARPIRTGRQKGRGQVGWKCWQPRMNPMKVSQVLKSNL